MSHEVLNGQEMPISVHQQTRSKRQCMGLFALPMVCPLPGYSMT